jgi:hypothetical protein
MSPKCFLLIWKDARDFRGTFVIADAHRPRNIKMPLRTSNLKCKRIVNCLHTLTIRDFISQGCSNKTINHWSAYELKCS